MMLLRCVLAGLALWVPRLVWADSAPARSAETKSVRFATYNCSLNRRRAGMLLADLREGSEQARQIAEILQRVRPDVVLLNEFDYDRKGEAARVFQTKYLAVSQNGAKPITYPHRFLAPVNTGVPTGLDLDRDGSTTGAGDAYGFGRFAGQYGMVLFSRYPLKTDRVRTFQKFLWKDMPGALLPADPATGKSYYSPDAVKLLRLSSKSHWDVPVQAPGRTIHVLCAHPTPPAFDGKERRNVKRNHDEIRLFADYIDPARSRYLYDDHGKRGGLPAGASFVIMGDMNADPVDGSSVRGAANQLLDHKRIRRMPPPKSEGAAESSKRHPKQNSRHKSDPANDTANFSSGKGPGNLRVDYVLPSKDLRPLRTAVFWPKSSDPLHRLIQASDHRLVYLDVAISAAKK
jgi:endonuclease/exonuclease/phosphatase family metal-dependent hydrolase